jgi:uncharacterized protein (TIGR03067 family)
MRHILSLVAVLLLGLAPAPPDRPKTNRSAEDVKALQGSWTCEEGLQATFEGDRLSFATRRGPGLSYRVKLDASARPRSIDLTGTDDRSVHQAILGIYSLEKDVLKLCCTRPGEGRPRSFEAKEGECYLYIFKREHP